MFLLVCWGYLINAYWLNRELEHALANVLSVFVRRPMELATIVYSALTNSCNVQT